MKNLKISRRLIALISTSVLALYTMPAVEAKADFYTQGDIVKTKSSVNMRLDNDLDGTRICAIPENQELKRILSCDNNWSLVIYKDRLGFVLNDYIDSLSEPNITNIITELSGYLTATSDVRLRLGPSTDDNKVGSIKENDQVEILGSVDNDWYLVRTEDKIGFVMGEYVEPSNQTTRIQQEEQVTQEPYKLGTILIYTKEEVNFRETPDKKGKKIKVLKSKTELQYLDYLENGWFKVLFDGIEGYVSGDYITFNKPGSYRDDFVKVVYATSKVKLRQQPTTESSELYLFDKYETAEVIGEEGEWYQVRVANKIGYVKKELFKSLSNRFVVVDISAQTLTLYDGNTILLETDVVTGTKGKHDTPTGMYEIYSKKTDTYLTGPGYKSHVDFWMPFNGGVGLHDADWRRKFGGNIYEANGSHGCVNIPSEKADDVYSLVKKNTKVVVQK